MYQNQYPNQFQQPNFQQPAQGMNQYPPMPQGGPPMPMGYPQQQAAPQQQPMTAPPPTYGVDDAQAQQAYQKAQQASQFKLAANFLKILGPRGETNWETVHPGYEGKTIVWICPPWAEGKPVFVEIKSHFFKSAQHPRGQALPYQGEDSLYMQAIRAGLNSPDPRLREAAQNWGKVRKQFLYNVLDLSNPSTHYGQDGIMRSFILGCGATVHGDIGVLAANRGGMSRVVNIQKGRPMLLIKKKTGPQNIDIDWKVIDQDEQPLNQYFWPALSNLWDLEAQARVPTQEEVITAIQEIGLPMPVTGASFGQVPPPYSSTHQAPWGMPQAQVLQGQAPQYQAPVQQPMYQAPQQFVPQPAMPMMQPQAVQQAMPPMPNQMAGMQQSMPAMPPPPPVSSQGPVSAYPPNPGMQPPPPAPMGSQGQDNVPF